MSRRGWAAWIRGAQLYHEVRVAPEVRADTLAGEVAEQAAALGDAGRGVQGDRLPHPVDVRLGDVVAAQQVGRQVGALHLEPGFPLGEFARAEIVQDGGGEQQVAVVGGVVQAAQVGGEEFGEQEAAHAVVDQRGALGGPRGGEDGLGQRAGRQVEREGVHARRLRSGCRTATVARGPGSARIVP